MKKTVYVFMVLAVMIAGAKTVSADSVTIPLVLHYSSSDYTQISIRNNAEAVNKISVSFNTNITKSSMWSTNTLAATTVTTASIAAGETWTILTGESLIFSSTTSIKRAQVVILTSATVAPAGAGDPVLGGGGPVGVQANFIHVSTAANPSGFSLPVFYRTRTWTSAIGGIATAESAELSGQASLVGSVTVDSWEQ